MEQTLTANFRELYRREPEILVRAPGRVNLLGAHVDYNDGWVLPAAIDRSIWLAAARTADGAVRIASLDYGQQGEASIAELAAQEGPPPTGQEQVRWLNYPAGVAWTLLSAGHELPGLEVVFAGDIPIGAGVSSSAAVEVAFLLAWNTLANLRLSPRRLAELGQQVENRFLGVNSGIMDQFASLHGTADHLIWLDCRTLDHEPIALSGDVAVLVADSGVHRELANSEYNLRRQQCQDALAALQTYVPEARALRDINIRQLERHGQRLPDVLYRRAKHVVQECERVNEGARRLRQGNLAAFGRLVRASHESSRDLYEVSIPELDLLAETAWNSSGCYGARLTGAGFGGCVVALVDVDAAEAVALEVQDAFSRRFGHSPTVFACRAASGASYRLLA